MVVSRAGKLRFVEVKVRDPDDPLSDDAVPPSKQSRLRSAARAWLVAHGEPDLEACFVVAYVDPASGGIRWVDDAFPCGTW